MVSIIIPNYNRVLYLEQALQSILVQTYSNWEVIVVDDGSTDESGKLVKSYGDRDNRIKWIERKSGLKGASVCRNIGINKAKGDYIIFLDSDDLLAPDCLDQRVKVMNENPELDFAVFPMLLFKEKIGDLDFLWNIETKETDFKRFLCLDAVWQTSGPIWKKTAITLLNGFDESLACWQDIDLHLRAICLKLKYIKKYNFFPDCYYRSDNKDSLSKNINSAIKLRSRFKVLKKIASINYSDFSLKPLSNNILISSMNAGNMSFFIGLLNWSFRKSIYTKQEYLKFIFLGIIKFSRLVKLKFIFNFHENLKLEYSIKTTVGVVSFKNK